MGAARWRSGGRGGRLGGGAGGLALVEAVAAEDRPVAGGLERHHGLGAAVGAHRGEHGLGSARATAPVAAGARGAASAAGAGPARTLAQLAAALAPRGCVGQTVVAVELLLTGRERELLTAVHTLDDPILKSSHDACRTSVVGTGVGHRPLHRKKRKPRQQDAAEATQERDRSAGRTTADETNDDEASRATTLVRT